MKKYLSKISLFGLSLLTALFVTSAFISPAFAEFAFEKQADKNCTDAILPEGVSYDIVADPTTKLVTVSYVKDDQKVETILSFRDAKKIAQCKPQIRELLTKVKTYEEKRDLETCNDLKAIVANKKVTPTRDGNQLDMGAAKKYVEKLCK